MSKLTAWCEGQALTFPLSVYQVECGLIFLNLPAEQNIVLGLRTSIPSLKSLY